MEGGRRSRPQLPGAQISQHAIFAGDFCRLSQQAISAGDLSRRFFYVNVVFLCFSPSNVGDI
jgi:hypothetical protein